MITCEPKKIVLMFAEDPGAANFIAPIATALCENNVDLKVLSAGKK